MTGVSGPSFSLPFVFAVVRFCIGVRSSPGEGPESPAHRSLRPKDPESPALLFFSAALHLCGAPLDRGPELPRRVPGVSGLAGVSGPKDRNLRPPR